MINREESTLMLFDSTSFTVLKAEEPSHEESVAGALSALLKEDDFSVFVAIEDRKAGTIETVLAQYGEAALGEALIEEEKIRGGTR